MSERPLDPTQGEAPLPAASDGTHEPPTGKDGPHRARRWLAPLALLVYAGFVLFPWVEDSWRPEWDGGIYLLAARSLAEGDGYSYLGAPFFLRPPGLSWMLSFVAPGPDYDWTSLNRFFAAWAVAAVVAVFVYLRGKEKTRPFALGCALAVGTTPLFVRNLNWVLSEFPSLALFFFGLAALERGGRRERLWWVWSLAGALLFAGAYHLRSVVLLALPAVALCGWRRDRGAQHLRAALPLVVFGLLVLPWTLHVREVAAEAPVPSEQLLLFDYGTALFHVDPGNPESERIGREVWLQRFERNRGELASDLARSLFGSREALWQWAAAGILLAGFLVSLARGADLLDGFFPFCVVLLLFYFDYDERLALPLAPLLYLYAAQLAWALARLLRRPAVARLVPGALLLAFVGWNATTIGPILDARSWAFGPRGSLGAEWSAWENAGRWIAEETAPEARVLCGSAPILSVLSDRRCYTYRFLRGDGFLQRYGIDHAVLEGPAQPMLVQYLRARAVEREAIEAPVRPIEAITFAGGR